MHQTKSTNTIMSHTSPQLNFKSILPLPPLLHAFEITPNRTVMVPTRAIDISYLDDTDLAGPLVFALIFGFCLLCTGKVHFGYIYGFGAFGCLSMALVLNLLGDKPIDTWKTCSVLGYCLLPVVVLSAVGIVLDLRGVSGLALSSAAVCWSCTAATKVSFISFTTTNIACAVTY
jgi:protein YIPF5/7